MREAFIAFRTSVVVVRTRPDLVYNLYHELRFLDIEEENDY